MEKEPIIKSPETEKFGRDVEIHAIFMRHGEKNADGTLSDAGKEEAKDFGENLSDKDKDAIKGYSSYFPRVLETVNQVIESAPHGKKLKTRIKTGLAPSSSQEFSKKFKEYEKLGPDAAAEWHFSFGNEKPDTGTMSPHEIAEYFAYLLTHYMKMSDRLYSGSNVDIINGTHQAMPEFLLKEVMIRKIDDKEIVGFEKLSDIGGSLKFTEGMEFVIATDNQGNKKLVLNFRGETYDIDTEKLYELSNSYAEKISKSVKQ